MADILDRILARKRAELEAARLAGCRSHELQERAAPHCRPRDFVGALRAKMPAGGPR